LKNKLLRLTELIQEGFPAELHTAFKFEEQTSLQERLDLASQAISYHQQQSADLWIAAGNKRSPEEKKATARAELAAFLLAYLTGSPKENAESAIEALAMLGRSTEAELITSLCKKRS
jgi:hypothetical protein